MSAYYNEFDPFAAQWLRNAIDKNLIAPGDVDERSIEDVRPSDLAGYVQCHFFAGIGGWSYAARLAGWPDARRLWTGSCPCQPYSVIGKQRGDDDERNLWPEFHRLIRELRPSDIAGEQVASAAGREWLAGVRTDLEALGYAVGGADLCAAGVGAPHIRQRLYWVGHTNDARLEGHSGHGDASGRPNPTRPATKAGRAVPWDSGVPITDRNGIRRLIEPGIEPMAHGVSARMGKLRAYGNAIVPQLGAEVLGALMECRP